MLKYLKKYENMFDDQLNTDLMTKAADEPLVEYIKDVWRSLEVAPPIHILRFEYTEDESKINVNKYIFKREKRKKKKDKVDYKFIQDNRCGALKVWIEITLPVKDPKTQVITIHKKTLQKSILVPLADSDGKYFIRGKNYCLIYQLVEKSTWKILYGLTINKSMKCWKLSMRQSAA